MFCRTKLSKTDHKAVFHDIFALYILSTTCFILSLCSGILPRDEATMVEVDLNAPEEQNSSPINDAKEEKSTISKL